MTMMFEVADLAVASPATVSRCGMVYLEPSYIGLEPFVECWLKKLPDNIYEYKDNFQELFDFFMVVRGREIETVCEVEPAWRVKLRPEKDCLCQPRTVSSIQAKYCS